MKYKNIETINALVKELTFQTTRSSGKGGQNVNKVSTKVILVFDVQNSLVLNEEQKQLLFSNYPGKINKEGQLYLSCSKERSQLMNKNLVVERFLSLLENAFEPQTERKKSKPTKASKVKLKKAKQEHSEKKSQRKKIQLE